MNKTQLALIASALRESSRALTALDPLAKHHDAALLDDALTAIRAEEAPPPAYVITPVDQIGPNKQHGICGIPIARMVELMANAALLDDDESKVSHSWGFAVNGVFCAVWSYKGSEQVGAWSAYGPIESLRLVFGDNVGASRT